MRPRPIKMLTTSALLGGLVSVSALGVLGCAGSPESAQGPAEVNEPVTRIDPPPPGGVTAEQLDRLMTRLDVLEADNSRLRERERQRELDAIDARRAQMEAQRQAEAIANQHNAGGGTQAEQGDPAAGHGTAQQPAAVPTGISQAQLLEAIIDQLMAGDDPARIRALKAAALSVMTDRHELDYRLLEELGPREREQVTRFHQMLAVLYEELAHDDSRDISRREMIQRIDEAIGQLPLRIAVSELCSRVDGYGIYEPFASHRFLGGRPMRMVVYVELENFVHHQQPNGSYEVKLTQEIEVYDSTGEVRVWRQAPVEIVDVSRNRRRDFYVVQPIELPARLAAGGYRMKIRVIDQHTGSRAETTIGDLEVVADRELVDR